MESTRPFVMRFLGYGIAWVEDLDDWSGTRGEIACSVASVAAGTFGDGCIAFPDPDVPGNYLVACPEGHIPGPMELSQLSQPGELEALRRTAAASGSEVLKGRVAMLEGSLA